MSLLERLQTLIASLTSEKTSLATNLTAKGVTASISEPLSALVAKVADIEQSGEDMDAVSEAIAAIETLVNGAEEE